MGVVVWYSESQDSLGNWYPCLTPDRPIERRADGHKPAIRYIAKIDPAHINYRWKRLSALYGDGNISADTHPDVKAVYLDGVKHNHASHGNIREGWLEVYLFDENGNHILDGDEVAHRRVYGKVTVEWL